MTAIQLSQSRIAAYQMCPKKYWFRYIKGIKGSENWPQLVKGNFTHDVLEMWIKGALQGEEPKRCLQGAFKYFRSLQKYQDFSIEKYIDEIKIWLRKVYEDYEARRYVPIAAEQKVEFQYHNIMMTGRIDRIDEVNPSTIKIIDYKTVKDPQYLTQLQLGIYHMGAKYGSLKSKYGNKNIQTAYVLLRHDVREKPYCFTTGDLDGFLDEIEDVAGQIATDKVWIPKPSRMCQYCDYFVQCTRERENVNAWW